MILTYFVFFFFLIWLIIAKDKEKELVTVVFPSLKSLIIHNLTSGFHLFLP